jgi:hypothetical protein
MDGFTVHKVKFLIRTNTELVSIRVRQSICAPRTGSAQPDGAEATFVMVYGGKPALNRAVRDPTLARPN